jgi:hypothetical protein
VALVGGGAATAIVATAIVATAIVAAVPSVRTRRRRRDSVLTGRIVFVHAPRSMLAGSRRIVPRLVLLSVRRQWLQGEGVPRLQGKGVPRLQGKGVPRLQWKGVPRLQRLLRNTKRQVVTVTVTVTVMVTDINTLSVLSRLDQVL